MKNVTLTVNNISYDITTAISVHDTFSLIDFTNSKRNDYNVAVANIIYEKMVDMAENRVSRADIERDIPLLITYINAIVASNKELQPYYEDLIDVQDECQRFVLAVYNQSKGCVEEIVEAIGITKQEVMEGLGKGLVALAETIKEAFEPMTRITAVVGEVLRELTTELASIMEDIKIPEISPTRKKELCHAYEQWGKFGWTIYPYADITFYSDAPMTREEANKKMAVYCTKDGMDDLFSLLNDTKGVKKRDLEEALYDFKQGKYKSCAMILFALLDAKIIRMQRKEDIKPYRNYRDSGNAAAKNIKNRIAKEQDIEKQWLELLVYHNLFTCIDTMFAMGGDFKVQPDIINRNFLHHGMMRRNVGKRDCIQLFLLYYNFVEFINLIKE